MSLYYTHLLIPATRELRADPNDIARFLTGVIELGVVGDAPEISFCTLKQTMFKERTGRNPFTGEAIVIRGHQARWPDRRQKLTTVGELPDVVGDAHEYNIDISNCTVPKIAPLPIDFADPYYVTVGCRQRSRLVSTSDLHDESCSGRKAIPFGQDCTAEDALGLFTHPESMATIEVPGAGCAKFWIEFELGKFLFPEIPGTDASILNPLIVELATRSFQMQFVQGFRWG